MKLFTLNPFPASALVTLTSVGVDTVSGYGTQVITVDDNAQVDWSVTAEQCTVQSGSVIVDSDKVLDVNLEFIGSVIPYTLVPSTGRSDFPVTLANLLKGGWHQVQSATERDLLVVDKRSAGMAVYVSDEKKLYILNDDLETWILFEAGGKVDDVKVNGESVVVNKIAEITVPTKTSDIENDGDGESPFATQDYVDEFGGKIDVIKVNNVEQEIVDKTVNITVPTKTSDIDNDSDFQTGTQVQTLIENNIVDNVTSTETTKSLSANQGKILQDQIDKLKTIGRFLSSWDCITGLPITNPQTDEYTYKTGDYFIVGIIDDASQYELYDSTKIYNTGDKVTYESLYYICNTDETTGEWDSTKWDLHDIINYRPDGTVYYKGIPSTVIETEVVNISDIYFYDGSSWLLLGNTQKVITFANIAGSPYDNTLLADELRSKQPALVEGEHIHIAEDGRTISADDTTYDAGEGISIDLDPETQRLVITNTNVSAEWGNITGTLSDQTDLQEVLDTKVEYAGQIKEWIDEEPEG